MKSVRKSVLVPYSPTEMFELVSAVPAYPQFLPWCQRAEVLSQEPGVVTARLHLAYAGVRHAFTTRNTQVAGQSVGMSLVDGPFSHLEGVWRFLPIGPDGKACKVEFELSYAFASRPLELVVSPVFDRIANTFVDAFVARAEQVHGKR